MRVKEHLNPCNLWAAGRERQVDSDLWGRCYLGISRSVKCCRSLSGGLGCCTKPDNGFLSLSLTFVAWMNNPLES